MAAGRGADVRVYPHGDVDALERELVGADRAIVVTDTVFSMDGDVAPVEQLRDVAARHGALLVTDDAHKVFDVEGLDDGHDDHLVRVGTLSKTLGSLGGFVAGSRSIVDLLVNRARPFIFTTAPTPADTAAARASLGIVRSAEGASRLQTLRARIDQLRPGHPTPIVPVVIGDEGAAVAASGRLLDEGLLVPAIRPPTVPAGTSRLRVALSAAHTEEQVERLRRVLEERL
jgi:7-keto-8-aminopelargonate synthetase-like enzyme